MLNPKNGKGWRRSWNEPLLYGLSFLECAMLPIPLEIFFLPLAYQLRSRLLRITLFSISFALLGGLVGYGLGYFWSGEIHYLLSSFVSPDTYDEAVSGIRENKFSFLLISGFTPIPFTLVTIAAGAVHYSVFYFLVATFLTRAPRMIVLALLIHFLGKRASHFYQENQRVVTISILLFAGAIVVWSFVLKQ